MEFKFLENEIRREFSQRLQNYKTQIQTEEGLNKVSKWVLNKRDSYKGNFEKQKEKILKALEFKLEKELNEQLNHLRAVEETENLRNPLIITIEWKKSKMWGNNPKAYTNYGFEGESIGGCGYDKLSTATAQALNSNLSILKFLYERKNKELENPKKEYVEQNGFKGNSQGHINAEIFGYGSGYNILPRFEGGVGVDCFKRILEKLGLKWENITSTNQIDVYRITKD